MLFEKSVGYEKVREKTFQWGCYLDVLEAFGKKKIIHSFLSLELMGPEPK
jgi:hypothetical protein